MNYKVGLSNVNMGMSFQQRVCNAAKQKAEDLGIELLILDAHDDFKKEMKNVERFLDLDVDAIIVVAVNYRLSFNACNKVREAKKPIIAMADPVEGGFCYVGSDRIQGGGASLTAARMIEVLKGKGNIVYIRGDEGKTEELRDIGFRKAINNYPQISIVYEEAGKWDFYSGREIMQKAIVRHHNKGDINAVFAHNDDMALGALETLKCEGRLNDPVYIFGIDGTPAFLDALEANEVTMTSFQNAELIGFMGIETIYKLLMGENVDEHIPVEWKIADAGNVHQYKSRWNEKKGMFEIKSS